MKQSYYIHSPKDWQPSDVHAIEKDLAGLGLNQDIDAAIGEGAGGAGFETVVEVVLNNPVVSGLISTAIYDIAKVLWARRPNNKKVPEGLPDRLDAYRLVVHVQTEDYGTIIGVDLKTDIKQIETAVSVKLEDKLKEKPSRVYQDGDDWDTF